VLPTAWQAVEYADVPNGGTLLVLGLGPIGDMSVRIATHRGMRVIAVDLVDSRLARGREAGAEVLDLRTFSNSAAIAEAVRELTEGRGADSVVDAVGMEAHGSPVASMAQKLTALLPDAVAGPLMQKAGVDRLAALYTAIEAVRRGGAVSLSGVYGGAADPMPMLQMFDKQLTFRMGQANVRRWLDDIWPLVSGDDDPLGTETFATHHLPLDDATQAYADFQAKADGMSKVVFTP